MKKLKSMENPKNVEGMARYGINPENNLGINVTTLRNLAKEIGKNHELALKLWDSGIHDARMLAAHVDDPKLVTEEQMEKWVRDFNSWDVCDNACGHLFDKTQYSYKKAREWSQRKEEFVKRAGFAIMAWAAVHDKKTDDSQFEELLSIIKRESTDERNYVKKAVNWALRNIGKRNPSINKKAIKTAEEIKKIDSKVARWIANDALRELTSEKIQKRIRKN
jgi:3-methyladenine DNA glycosylase AlkD